MHSFCRSKTSFAKPLIPAQEAVSLTNPGTVQFTLIAMGEITIF